MQNKVVCFYQLFCIRGLMFINTGVYEICIIDENLNY